MLLIIVILSKLSSNNITAATHTLSHSNFPLHPTPQAPRFRVHAPINTRVISEPINKSFYSDPLVILLSNTLSTAFLWRGNCVARWQPISHWWLVVAAACHAMAFRPPHELRVTKTQWIMCFTDCFSFNGINNLRRREFGIRIQIQHTLYRYIINIHVIIFNYFIFN